MIRPLLVLALAFGALLFVERAQTRAADAERRERARVGRPVSAEEASALQLGALEVDDAVGGRALYVPYAGRWRCRSKDGAPADTAALNALFSDLTATVGIVQEEAPADPALYGFGTSATLRVVLHGPAAAQPPHEDPVLSFDVGVSLQQGGSARSACYVRRVGERRIWLLEADPRALLEARVAPDLPPLLEPFVVPRDWPGWKSLLARVRFFDGERARFVLERRVPPPDADVDPRERPPWIWVLDPGPNEDVAVGLASHAYTRFLEKIPYVDVLGPRERAGLGLESPPRRLELEPGEGATLVLQLGPPLPDGRLPLWNEDTQRAYLLAPEVAALLTPDAAAFRVESDANPWDPYLRR